MTLSPAFLSVGSIVSLAIFSISSRAVKVAAAIFCSFSSSLSVSLLIGDIPRRASNGESSTPYFPTALFLREEFNLCTTDFLSVLFFMNFWNAGFVLREFPTNATANNGLPDASNNVDPAIVPDHLPTDLATFKKGL